MSESGVSRWLVSEGPRAWARARYGNDAHQENNHGYQRALRRHRQALGVGSPGSAASRVDRLDALGFEAFEPGYSADVVEAVRNGYDKVIDEADRCVDMGGRIPGAVRYVRDPLDQVPALRDLLNRPVLDVVDAFYGAAWTVQHVRMWRIQHLPEAERRFHHYGNLWHCDQHPVSTLKLFVQISDGVSGAGGAFRFHDVPSTRRIMRSGYVDQWHVYGPARRAMEDPARVHLFDGPAGSVAFVSTPRVLHRAGVPPEGQDRGMVQFTFDLGPRRSRTTDPFDGMLPDPNVVPGRTA